jgi:predicted HicB family RNase H-like nuclease
MEKGEAAPMQQQRRIPAPPRTQVAKSQLTLRIPQTVYDEVLKALDDTGDSANFYIVEAIRQRLQRERGWLTPDDPADRVVGVDAA